MSHPSRRWVRRLAILTAGVVILLVVVVGVLHTPPARSWVLRQALSRIAPDGTITAASVRYNLLTLRVELSGVEARSTPDDAPYFTADTLLVDAPWSAIRNPSLQRLRLVNPRLSVRVQEDGTSNFTGGGTRVEMPLPIEQLDLENLSLRWQDDRLDAAFRAERLGLRIAPEAADSWLRQGEPATIRRGDAEARLQVADGTLGWNGLDALLRDLDLASDPATLAVDGRVDELLADRQLDLRTGATADLGGLVPLAPELGPVSGRIELDASVAGTAEAPVVDGSVRAPRLARADVALSDVELDFRWDKALAIERFTAGIGGGQIEADGRVAPGAESSELRASWSGIDIDTLVAALASTEMPQLGTRSSGEATASWIGTRPVAESSALSLRAELQPDDRDGLTGNARLELAEGAFDGEFAAATDLRQISGLAPDLGPLAGRVSLSGTIAGSVDAPRAGGRGAVQRMTVADSPPLDAEVRFEIGDERWRLTDGSLAAADATARFGATGDLGLTSIDGTASVRADDLDATVTRVANLFPDLALPDVRGDASAELRVGGRPFAPTVTGSVSSAELMVAGQGPFTASSDVGVDLSASRWQLDDVKIDGPATSLRLTATGDLALDSIQGTLDLQASALEELTGIAAGFVPDTTLPAVGGRADANLEFRGSPAAPAIAGTITAESLTIAGQGPFSVRADLEHEAGATRITEMTVREGAASLRLTGWIGPGAARVEASAQLLVDDLASASELDWLSSVGRVRGRASLRADRLARTGELDLDDLFVQFERRSLRLVQPGRLAWAPEAVRAEGLAFVSGNTTLDVNGRLPTNGTGGNVVARLRGELGELEDVIDVAWSRGAGTDTPAPRLTGSFDVRASLAGSLDDMEPALAVQLSDGTVGWRDLDPVESIDVTAELTPQLLRVTDLAAAWRGAGARGSATVPASFLPGLEAGGSADPARLDLRLLSLSPALMRGFVPDELLTEAGGGADLTVELTAARPELEAVNGEARFDSLRLWRADREIEQRRPTRLTIAGTRVEVVEWDWVTTEAGGPALTVAGNASLDPDDPLASTLDLRLEAEALLAWFNGLVPDTALSGRVDASIAVAGSPAEPRVNGTINLREAGLAMREPRLVVTELEGTLRLDGTRIDTDGIPGRANGGDVMLFANVDFTDPLAPTGTAGVNGRGIALEAMGARANTDLSLTLSARPNADPVLLGEITVREGGYRSNRPLTADMFGALSAPAAASSGPGTTRSFLERLRYDIQVESDEDLLVDTQYAQLGIGLDLEVVGAGERPGILGEIRLGEGGEVRLGGNTLIIDQGTIDFADARRIAPTLDIEATSRVQRYDVSVSLSGNAFSPTLNATASGGLSQADALSLLTVGRTLEQAGGAGTDILAEQAFNVVAGRAQGIAGAVGISSVRFEQARAAEDSRSLAEPDLFPRTTDLAARLSITRTFGEVFDLTYSQGLTATTEQSWIGRLRLPFNLDLVAGTYDDGTRAAELHHGFQIGRAANDPRVAAKGVRARVETVEFAGAPGRGDAELLRVVDLEPGDRFDYISWRRDVERLQRRYREDGHYEVTVQARREPVGSLDPDTGRAARYALEYTIEPGPRTELVVEGFDLSGSARERLRQIWFDAVADVFLLADLVDETERELARRGHVAAQVRTEVNDTPGERRIVITVEPGPRYRQVETRIVGTETFPAGDITSHLRSVELSRAVWWAPQQVVDEIERYYADRGFRDAAVEVGEPRLEGERATIEVRVDEGGAQRLASIGFDGNAVLTDAELRAAIALREGQRLSRNDVESAALALETRYVEQAYNDALVTLRRVPVEMGVALTFRITEGPRRVLQEVRIDGRQRTRRALLENAIGLRPGDPLILGEVQSIRRRLMSTGALASATVRVENVGEPVNGEAPARIVVTVVEKAMFDIRYGVQVLSETLADERRTRPGVSAVAAHNNFLGIGARMSVMGRYRSKEPFGRFSLSFPRFFGLPIRTTLIAQKSREEIAAQGAFTTRRDETRLLAEQRVSFGRLTVGASYSWERNLNQILELPPDSPLQLPPAHIARIIPTLIWDGRDDVFAPRKGLFHSSTLELATEAIGSDLEFWKYSGQQYWFAPAGPVVLAGAVRFGNGSSQDPNSDILPRGELFLAGGGTSVRGYPDDSLGRTEFFGSFFPGGNALLVVNQEARFPIWRWLHGVAFADAGSSFESASDITFDSLAYSAGAGLRLVTPYVILRLDYGFRLSDIDYLDDEPGRLHFGIGHIF